MKGGKTVHVIFKTHLDIGFTDLAQNVLEKYMDLYIPSAIELADRLAAEGGAARFRWTTGSWLIDEYLRRSSDEKRKKLEDSIAKGHIVWHGLPFTTHTELLDPGLFVFGLSISKRLDRNFGKSTIAAKMTDVPGHTRAIIPHLARHGIRYLHLGVNPASKVPGVPSLFVWKGKDGSEIVVNYADDYGNVLEIDGFDHVMVFAHTGDNCGTPSAEEIKRTFADLAARFPGADIRASTMDAYAEELMAVKDRFPVMHEEIGDTWIHGIATDPKKVAQYRVLMRLRNQWLEQERFDLDGDEYKEFSTNLLLIAEHTWGMDEKTHLTDFTNYSIYDFKAARARDIVTREAIPGKYSYFGYFWPDESLQPTDRLNRAELSAKSYRVFESSWQEQRDYLTTAIRSLDTDKQAEARKALNELEPFRADFQDAPTLDLRRTYELGCFQVEFAVDGSIAKLIDRSGKAWADGDYPLGVLRYETFGVENYNAWFEQYIENIDKTYIWAESDFGKPGMEFLHPRPKNQRYSPTIAALRTTSGEQADRATVLLGLPVNAVEHYGAPKEIQIDYLFYHDTAKIDVTLQWFDKQANRLPEAVWFSFAPKVDNPNLWMMDKMGERISPLEVVKDGNRNLHAVNTGIYYDGADGIAVIETVDAPLVAPGERRLLQFDNTFASLDGGMHFVLYNNLWGTNFPMWYEEDAKFRFSLLFRNSKGIV